MDLGFPCSRRDEAQNTDDWDHCVQENPDENLLVAVGDAVPALAAALGPDAYAPIFAQQHAEALFRWLRGSQPDSVRAAGTGVCLWQGQSLAMHEMPRQQCAAPGEHAYVFAIPSQERAPMRPLSM